MSRYTGPNPDYAQRATLWMSLRAQPEGGDLRNPCEVGWLHGHAVTQTDLVVLVHGFNNNLEEAQSAYLGFRKRQDGLLRADDAARLEAMLGDVFWPGDAQWGAFDFLDFLYYPKSIAQAKAAAPLLADCLMARSDVQNLYFIGHSMGCRVVLETIKVLRARGHATPIRKVCLMAAAVPTEEVCAPDGLLADAFIAADHVRVLYSPADTVLAWAFPVGETAGGDGVLPTAIGRHGDVPLQPGHVDRDWIPNAAHSDYWGWKDDDASAIAAQEIAAFLGIGPQTQTLRERVTAPARPDPPPRAQPVRRIGHP